MMITITITIITKTIIIIIIIIDNYSRDYVRPAGLLRENGVSRKFPKPGAGAGRRIHGADDGEDGGARRRSMGESAAARPSGTAVAPRRGRNYKFWRDVTGLDLTRL